ncbi:MAG: Gfo/Idh/MocA family oxidoreductase [Phycisphaerae bacterium]|nr:Gfo/Idh/MocA family oxidoreductase [Phycisphaerae bacterium]
MAVRIGIIGAGGIAQHHAKTLCTLPEATIAAAADPNQANAKVFADSYGSRTYSDAARMLEGESDLDAVMIASGADVRLEPIRQVCERGVALFCEKPPALDLASAVAAKEAIERAGILNTVGFQTRWSPSAKRLRELMTGRRILFARVVIAWPVFKWVEDGLAPGRLYTKAGCGGPMIEQGIHYQDVLRYITQDEPVWVQAVADLGKTEPIEGRDCEDTTIVTARHASGMVSAHVHNWSHVEHLLQMQLVGNEFDLTWRIDEGEVVVGRLDGKDVDERLEANPYAEEMKGFVAAVAAKDQSMLRSTYADACKSLAVCVAATRAVETRSAQDIENV